jgi:hypothetical protein
MYMNIVVKNLGIISSDKESVVKFILTDSGILLLGKCLWHKDLVAIFFGEECNFTIIGAGVVPEDIHTASLDKVLWGNWRSNGYNIVTEESYRELIRAALIPFEKEVNGLLEEESDVQGVK